MSESSEINPSGDKINTSEKRIISLTDKGTELYEKEKQKHINIFKTLWKEVETNLNISANIPDNVDLLCKHKCDLQRLHEKYRVASRNFVECLQHTGTSQSHTDLDLHTALSQAHEQLLSNVISQLTNQISRITECASRHSKSVKSRSSMASNLSSILALRGKVKQFRSDRGTHFVGAVRDLDIDAVNVEDGPVSSFLYQNGVEWICNPPHSSHMGGVWERMIGITRRILDSMLKSVLANNLTHDVLVTLMAEVCAIVSARPLVPVSNDPDSAFILIPSMLLTQKNDLPTEPPLDFDLGYMYTKQWKRVQVLSETFWQRWMTEYLHTLQLRRKWKGPQFNIEKDDIVLLKDKDLPRNDWAMGIVQSAIPGEDGKVRKCIVRINRGGQTTSYTRPISEIVLLMPKNGQ